MNSANLIQRRTIWSICVIGMSLLIFSCKSISKNLPKTSQKDSKNRLSILYASSIRAKDLSTHLYRFASDEFEGRLTGEDGHRRAAEYLKSVYVNYNIPSPLGASNYFQEIPSAYFNLFWRSRGLKASENVLAYIQGSEKPHEVLIISAHMDHIGKQGNTKIFNGADDDGSGNVALLEIAEAFKKAAEDGNGPKRSILFLHVTGEEKGLLGSRFYVQNPVFPLQNTVANLNIDMIGRVDSRHKKEPNYIYLIGSDKLSSELHSVSEQISKEFSRLKIDYRYNDADDPNRFYYRSDHYNFAQQNIPIIFYFNGTHEDYHKDSDTADKINYELLEKRTKLIFHTAWELANREHRVFVDKSN